MSEGLDAFGLPNWRLVLCLALVWFIVFLILIKGVKSAGKVSGAVVVKHFLDK